MCGRRVMWGVIAMRETFLLFLVPSSHTCIRYLGALPLSFTLSASFFVLLQVEIGTATLKLKNRWVLVHINVLLA
jgi:hypothetical protein